MAAVLSAIEDTTRVMTFLLGGIAAVSLVVGGIGIMNIMLVSVTERTREIGIRMAVGATPSDILIQFLVEAFVLSISGGIIGTLVGWGTTHLLSYLAGWKMMLVPWVIALAMGFSAAVGIFFGYYPAKRAASASPAFRVGAFAVLRIDAPDDRFLSITKSGDVPALLPIAQTLYIK
jgi:putative ABC transport system permease protein